jgi:hypothetical protein
VSGESDGTARSRRWWLSHLSGDSLDESSDHAAEQNHWSERGQATSVANADALGRPVAQFCYAASSNCFCMSFIYHIPLLPAAIPVIALLIGTSGLAVLC